MHPAIRRFLSDRNGNIVVAQRPNLPLLAWAGFAIAASATRGEWSAYFGWLSAAALLTWSYLEIRQGDSPFRRVLGAVVLVALLVSRFP